PATFAAGNATGAVVYKFDRASIGSPDTDVALADEGFPKVENGVEPIYTGKNPWRLGGLRRGQYVGATADGFSYKAVTSRLDTENEAIIAIALEVKDGGKYIPSLTYKAKANAPIVNVYFAKSNVTIGNYSVGNFEQTMGNHAAIKYYVAGLGDYKIGSFDMYSSEPKVETHVFDAPLSLDGESVYYLYVCGKGKNDGYIGDTESVQGKNVLEILLNSFTLTPVEDESAPVELSGNIAFAAGADIQYKIGEGSYTNIAANNTAQIPVGSSVTVKVTDTDNFAGWVRGTKDSGVWVSSDPEYNFSIMSPTYLTPIYTTPEENATHSVEFWDENGAYVDTVTATDGKAVFPDEDKYGLVGGSFNGWWLNATTQLNAGDDVEEGITRAVAKYNYGDFGKPIQNSNASATCWKRGDVTVAYGDEYTFYQWNGTANITSGTDTVENKPLVVLDATPVDGAYMIEYDKGNAKEIVEAGILFGSDADIHIGSTDGSKAASQRNGDDTGHGQFCAKPNTKSSYNYARGYLIYKGTDNKLYVIYTAAVATAASAQ
ncbi:MAG: hypothetical protein IJP38_01985, partial [Oscillospiraceae bacterium]|nr:hypothetical protein [Oscillospiraceae bacterium]